MSDAIAGALPDAGPGARVALLGGSFNPPHVAHALLAHSVLAVGDVEQVWVLPTAQHPFGKDLAPLSHRLAMARLAFRHLGDRVSVSELEDRLPAPSYTVQTLRAIHAARPGISLLWVAGTDILAELPLWREHEALLEMCELFLVPRPGFDDEGRARLGFALPDVSSTAVREHLARGRDVEGLLDAQVLAYVREHGLYGHSAGS